MKMVTYATEKKFTFFEDAACSVQYCGIYPMHFFNCSDKLFWQKSHFQYSVKGT